MTDQRRLYRARAVIEVGFYFVAADTVDAASRARYLALDEFDDVGSGVAEVSFWPVAPDHNVDDGACAVRDGDDRRLSWWLDNQRRLIAELELAGQLTLPLDDKG